MKLAPNDVHELRGCELCAHHAQAAGELVCLQPTVAALAGQAQVPCRVARYSSFGDVQSCGRDAQYMSWAPVALPLRHSAPAFA